MYTIIEILSFGRIFNHFLIYLYLFDLELLLFLVRSLYLRFSHAKINHLSGIKWYEYGGRSTESLFKNNIWQGWWIMSNLYTRIPADGCVYQSNVLRTKDFFSILLMSGTGVFFRYISHAHYINTQFTVTFWSACDPNILRLNFVQFKLFFLLIFIYP